MQIKIESEGKLHTAGAPHIFHSRKLQTHKLQFRENKEEK